MTRPISFRPRGFSLLEVLVAVIILSVGLLALASLQLSLMRSSTESKAQSIALAIAKDKLEDLRSFQNMAGYIAVAGSGPTTQTVGGETFSTTTTVARYGLNNVTGVFDAITNGWTEAQLTAGGYVVGKDFKTAKVDVSWTEATGTTQHVILNDVIDGLDPTAASKVVKNTSASAARKAKVIIYNPSGEAGVIPIAIDPTDNTNTAATNPKPVIDDNGAETRFDVLTYVGLSGGKAEAQSKVETVAIKCTCDTATAPGGTTARGYRPTYWNGLRYVAPTLTTYVPPAGEASGFAASQSPYCYECCRDHNDPGSLAAGKPKFDPWRNTHTHYKNNAGTLVAVGGGQTQYDEACRVIRVDGIFRIAADFNNEYFNLLPSNNNTLNGNLEYAPTATAITNYQAMVLAYLDAKITSNTTPSTYNNPVASGTVTSLETTNSINLPASITIPRVAGSYKWMHARGLYHDYLEAEALAAIASAKATCVTNNCTTAQKTAAVLELLPFTSINLTELAGWTPVTAQATYIDVLGNAFGSSASDGSPLTAEAPVRGKATIQMTNLPANAVTVNGVATQYTSNSGLTAWSSATATSLLRIDTDETSKTDQQGFDIAAGGAGGGSNQFIINFPNTYGTSKQPTFSSTSTDFTGCSSAIIHPNGNASNDYLRYTCGLGAASVANLPFTITGYNYADSANTQAAGRVLNCTRSDGVGSATYTTKANSTALRMCNDFTVAFSAPGVTFTPNAGNPFLPTKMSEYYQFTANPAANAATWTATMTAQTKYPAGYTCTYTGSAPAVNGSNVTITNTTNACPP